MQLTGTALHSGAQTTVRLVRRAGPLTIGQRGEEVFWRDLAVLRTDAGVCVARGGVRVDLVEHLFAAIGAMRIRDGLFVQVEGGEVPLMDGGCAQFCKALQKLGFATNRSAPPLRIVKPATFREGSGSESVYEFEPSDEVCMAVTIAFDHRLIVQKTAQWHGDVDDFTARIAPARTFGFRRDRAMLQRTGRATMVDLSAVIVLEDDGTTSSEPGPLPDECARHKLLDLIGDFALKLGVVTGTVRAHRPGHTATHRVIAQAQKCGVFG